MGIRLTLKVNGASVTRDVEPNTLLVELPARDLRLTGTHVGCDTAQCGACTVHVERPRGEVLQHAGGAGRRAPRSRRSKASPRPTARCTRCRPRSRSATACNAASARRAW